MIFCRVFLRPQVNREALNQRQAAVLIPVVRRAQPGLLLTQRSPIYVSTPVRSLFRGRGRQLRRLADCRRAAEAQEEVAIPPEAVEVIGVLPPVDSVTGFQVTPVVGIIPPGLQYHASVDEVSAVFEMPLEEALRLSRYHPLDIQRRGHDHRVWLSWYQHYFVWGMTAGIIRELALQIGLKP
jgi:hypothetical protein